MSYRHFEASVDARPDRILPRSTPSTLRLVSLPAAVPREHAETWSHLDLSLRWHERLHAFVVADGAVFVLIDTNSDKREIEMRIYVKARDETWSLVVELDDVGDPGMAPVEMPGYTYGRSQPGGAVTISYRNEMRSVRADSLGWWAFFDMSASGTDDGWDGATPLQVD